jgi:hypothetical protein
MQYLRDASGLRRNLCRLTEKMYEQYGDGLKKTDLFKTVTTIIVRSNSIGLIFRANTWVRPYITIRNRCRGRPYHSFEMKTGVTSRESLTGFNPEALSLLTTFTENGF